MSGQESPRTIGQRWVLIGAVIVVAAVAVAALVLYGSQDQDAGRGDCAIVEQLAREWAAEGQAAQDPDRTADRADLVALADRESATAGKIRAAQDSVSAKPVKAALEQWAQGAQLSAKVQRDAANEPSDQSAVAPTPAGQLADMRRSAQLIGPAIDALQKICPNLPTSAP